MLAPLTLVPIILCVAYLTLADRKGIGILQRRVGPNTVGKLGLLQPFADALKLLTKELIYLDQMLSGVNQLLPLVTLATSLAGYAVVPFKPEVVLIDLPLQILVTLALIGLAIHGILYISWGAGNSFSFLGSVRTAAQLVSYELPLTTALFIAGLLAGSLHYSLIENFGSPQALGFQAIPVVMIFLVSALAETARTPFDLPEAESELVAGFMTEISATPFVLFFLAEYSSLALLSILTGVIFLTSGSYTPNRLILTAPLLVFIAV